MDEGLLSVSKITLVVVAIFTLLFQFFPGLRVKWASLATEVKKRIIVGVYVVPGAIVAFGGCFPAFAEAVGLPLMCVGLSVFSNFIFGVLIAVGAGQGAFGLIPEMADVTAAKAVRDAATLAATAEVRPVDVPPVVEPPVEPRRIVR